MEKMGGKKSWGKKVQRRGFLSEVQCSAWAEESYPGLEKKSLTSGLGSQREGEVQEEK